jgi:metal iron transporter
MPHSLFLGSHLATQDRVSKESMSNSMLSDNVSRRERLRYIGRAIWRNCRSLFIVEELDTRPKSHEHRENNALEFVQSHLYHGIIDVVGSLLGFAVIINAL